MLTARDHHRGGLFDPWEYLGPKRRRLLDQSRAGVLRECLLKRLPAGELATKGRDDFGRPTKRSMIRSARTDHAGQIPSPGLSQDLVIKQ